MTPRPVRIGVQLQPQHGDYAALRRAVARAEELGVDVAFNWDHFFPLFGAPDGRHFECWTTLAAWAEQTDRIEIGALVTCNTYRNPELLADMARTVDHISGGRLILGIGSGWFERDYAEYGYEFGTAGGRLDALAAALPRIEARWAQLNPAPTRKIPTLIGGGGERKTLRIVARHADIWHGFGDLATITHKNAVLDDWCGKEGRDPEAIERSCGVQDDPSRSADALHDAGVRLFTIGTDGPGWDLGLVEDWLAWRDSVNAAHPVPGAAPIRVSSPPASWQERLQRKVARTRRRARALARQTIDRVRR
jgi:probable F420-dependent oxidoreductase